MNDLRTSMAWIISEHWNDQGRCHCGKQDREYTEHVADVLYQKLGLGLETRLGQDIDGTIYKQIRWVTFWRRDDSWCPRSDSNRRPHDLKGRSSTN